MAGPEILPESTGQLSETVASATTAEALLAMGRDASRTRVRNQPRTTTGVSGLCDGHPMGGCSAMPASPPLIRNGTFRSTP